MKVHKKGKSASFPWLWKFGEIDSEFSISIENWFQSNGPWAAGKVIKIPMFGRDYGSKWQKILDSDVR